jgi:hypothetical protein
MLVRVVPVILRLQHLVYLLHMAEEVVAEAVVQAT